MASMDVKSRPLSLEMFNHAATNLNDKRIITLDKIHQVLIQKVKTYLKMDYSVNKRMPEALFVLLLMDKALMLKKHLKDTESDLRLTANIGPNMATIKLYNIREEEDSQKMHVTISNLHDIDKQLY